LPQDWSHSHAIYSNPGSIVDALRDGSSDSWMKLTADLRFRIQQFKRNAALAPTGNSKTQPPPSGIKPDWAMSLGTGGLAPGTYPAKYVFDPNFTASCTDYVVYALTSGGANGGQASIVAFNNLYRGGTSASPTGLCAGTPGNATSNIPTVAWAYNTTTISGTIQTSPVLSGDGTMVAFIETAASGAVLHILKPKPAGQGTTLSASAVDQTFTSASSTTAYHNCLVDTTQSCMFTTNLFAPSGTAGITKSSPWYVYFVTATPPAGTDIVLVGDDNGKLHRFDNVFYNPTTASPLPVEHFTNGWPVTINSTAGTYVTSPVYDISRDRVIVGDKSGAALHVNTALGATATLATAATGFASAGAIVDGPLVDVTNGSSFFFFRTNGSAAGVAQIDSSISAPSVLRSVVATKDTAGLVYIGALNDSYYGNPTAAGSFLYFCGFSGSGHADLLSVKFSANLGHPPTMNSGTPAGDVNFAASKDDSCSPITEFLNSTDRLFVSNTVAPANIFSATAIQTPAITTGPSESGGTSGIIVDNLSGAAQASSLYFGTLATGNTCSNADGSTTTAAKCAVKLTQALLN
jgi:hypothetical protein